MRIGLTMWMKSQIINTVGKDKEIIIVIVIVFVTTIVVVIVVPMWMNQHSSFPFPMIFIFAFSPHGHFLFFSPRSCLASHMARHPTATGICTPKLQAKGAGCWFWFCSSCVYESCLVCKICVFIVFILFVNFIFLSLSFFFFLPVWASLCGR